MEYIEDARQQVMTYKERLQDTTQKLIFLNNDAWTQSQLKQDEISYTKSLKLAQESLARIEQSRRERINEMTPEEKKREYDKMCQQREATKMDYVLMYGFDAWEKR